MEVIDEAREKVDDVVAATPDEVRDMARQAARSAKRAAEDAAKLAAMAAGAAALTETFAILESALANPLDCR